jgi:WD40 repeat protein
MTGVLESNFDPRPVRLWNINSGKLLGEGTAVQLIRRLAFNPSATLLAAAAGDNSIVLFATNDFAAPQILTHFKSNAPDVAFSPDGHYLAAAGDAEVLLYKIP